MPDFDTIFVSGGDNEVHTKTYVRRQSDGFTVPHDSPLAPSIIGAQVDNAALKSLGDALVKAGSIDQAALDGALAVSLQANPEPISVSPQADESVVKP